MPLRLTHGVALGAPFALSGSQCPDLKFVQTGDTALQLCQPRILSALRPHPFPWPGICSTITQTKDYQALCVSMPIAVLPVITENKAKAGQKSMETMKESTCKEQIN